MIYLDVKGFEDSIKDFHFYSEFPTNSELLSYQTKAYKDILKYIRQNIHIESTCPKSIHDYLEIIINKWMPNLDWEVTSFFRKIETSQKIEDINCTYTLTLKSTVSEICNHICEINSLIKEYLQSILFRCSDVNLITEIDDRLIPLCSDDIIDRFNCFVEIQFDSDINRIKEPSAKVIPTQDNNELVVYKNLLSVIDVLLSYQYESFSRGEIKKYKKDIQDRIKDKVYKYWAHEVIKNPKIAEKILKVWQPVIFWDYECFKYGLETRALVAGEELVTRLKYTITSAPATKDVICDFVRFIASITSLRHSCKCLNGEKQLLRDLYSLVYVYLENNERGIMEDIICSKCNVCFLDYSNEYYEDEYFEIVDVHDEQSSGTKFRALVSNINGECLGKGLYRNFKIKTNG